MARVRGSFVLRVHFDRRVITIRYAFNSGSCSSRECACLCPLPIGIGSYATAFVMLALSSRAEAGFGGLFGAALGWDRLTEDDLLDAFEIDVAVAERVIHGFAVAQEEAGA